MEKKNVISITELYVCLLIHTHALLYQGRVWFGHKIGWQLKSFRPAFI